MNFKQKGRAVDGTYVPGFDGGFYSKLNHTTSAPAVSTSINRTFYLVFTFVLSVVHLFFIFVTSRAFFSAYFFFS